MERQENDVKRPALIRYMRKLMRNIRLPKGSLKIMIENADERPYLPNRMSRDLLHSGFRTRISATRTMWLTNTRGRLNIAKIRDITRMHNRERQTWSREGNKIHEKSTRSLIINLCNDCTSKKRYIILTMIFQERKIHAREDGSLAILPYTAKNDP